MVSKLFSWVDVGNSRCAVKKRNVLFLRFIWIEESLNIVKLNNFTTRAILHSSTPVLFSPAPLIIPKSELFKRSTQSGFGCLIMLLFISKPKHTRREPESCLGVQSEIFNVMSSRWWRWGLTSRRTRRPKWPDWEHSGVIQVPVGPPSAAALNRRKTSPMWLTRPNTGCSSYVYLVRHVIMSPLCVV